MLAKDIPFNATWKHTDDGSIYLRLDTAGLCKDEENNIYSINIKTLRFVWTYANSDDVELVELDND